MLSDYQTRVLEGLSARMSDLIGAVRQLAEAVRQVPTRPLEPSCWSRPSASKWSQLSTMRPPDRAEPPAGGDGHPGARGRDAQERATMGGRGGPARRHPSASAIRSSTAVRVSGKAAHQSPTDR
jgi:hypothetical protein